MTDGCEREVGWQGRDPRRGAPPREREGVCVAGAPRRRSRRVDELLACLAPVGTATQTQGRQKKFRREFRYRIVFLTLRHSSYF